MQISPRTVLALIVSPLIGGVIYGYAVVTQTAAAASPTPPEFWTNFAFAAVASLVFEVVVLLPVSLLLRRHRLASAYSAGVGAAAWFGLSVAGFLALGQGWSSATATAVQMLVLGLPVVASFVLLAGSQRHA